MFSADEKKYVNVITNESNLLVTSMCNIEAISQSIEGLPLNAVETVLEKINIEKNNISSMYSELKSLNPSQRFSGLHELFISTVQTFLECTNEFYKGVEHNSQSHIDKATFLINLTGSKLAQLNDEVPKLIKELK